MSDSILREAAAREHAGKLRVVWFLGPRPASWNGVMRYSLSCVEMAKSYTDIAVQAVDIPAPSRSLKRYWTHFVLYPLRAMAMARSVDLVVLYQEDMAYMIPFVRLAGGRVCIVMHHVVHPGGTRGVVETLKSWYMRLLQPLIARANYVISTTDVTVQDAFDTLGVRPGQIGLVADAFDERIAPTGAGVRRAARAALESRLGIALGEALVLLNVGTDETRKNNVSLFRALAETGRKDIVILRVGKAQNASNRRECEAVASAAGFRAHFVEGASDEDLGYCYQAADAYVSPTLHEGFGRTVIEAQLVGLPVIATDLPVYRYTMGNSFLAVSEPTKTAGWIDAIARLADDPALRDTLSREGRINAARFSTPAVSAQLHRALSAAARA